MTLHLLILSGTVGVGKSTLGGEIHTLLSEREIPNAFFDLDALRYEWPETSPWNAELVADHLRAMWPNLERRGVSYLVLAGVMETPSDVDLISDALAPDDVTIVRPTAPEAVRTQRLRDRMPPGGSLDWHLARTVELDEILDTSAVEMIDVDNGDRTPRRVAVEILERIGWTTPP
jgi:hypothetical protein